MTQTSNILTPVDELVRELTPIVRENTRHLDSVLPQVSQLTELSARLGNHTQETSERLTEMSIVTKTLYERLDQIDERCEQFIIIEDLFKKSQDMFLESKEDAEERLTTFKNSITQVSERINSLEIDLNAMRPIHAQQSLLDLQNDKLSRRIELVEQR